MSRHVIFFCLVLFRLISWGNSWKQAQIDRAAKIDCYWFVTRPFIYEDEGEGLKGMEYELMLLFQEYLDQKHQISLKINWQQHESFLGIMNEMKTSKSLSVIGLSAYSITEERKQYIQFTDPYLPDVTVLVSSQGTPILNSSEEIQQMFQNMTAVTIKGTIYEDLLIKLRADLGIDFQITYIYSDKNILENILQSDDRFGFIDLPIYLMLMENGGDLTRQNFFSAQGNGYGFILPKSSDWAEPINAFFSDPDYKARIDAVMSQYLGSELFEFIDQVTPREELSTSILTKEKKIQLALIKNANLKIKEEERFIKTLISGIITATLFLIIIVFFYINNQQKTKKLLVQKAKIEAQQEDIRTKNEKLTNRNTQLIKLNEDKNELVKILAHDLRSPLGQIIGYGDALGLRASGLVIEDREMLLGISHAADRMEQMITKILNTDNVEGKRSLVLKEHIELAVLIEDLISRYKVVAEKKDIILIGPIKAIDFLFNTDHMLLFLILENLISNAIKFSPSKTAIHFNVEKIKDSIIFEIKDEGPGLAIEDQVKAFMPFQKLKPVPTGNETSTGLGLSIVKKYATDLGGEVWIESALGKGSSFFVSLPV